MKRITVYADFDFLPEAQEIGVLGYDYTLKCRKRGGA